MIAYIPVYNGTRQVIKINPLEFKQWCSTGICQYKNKVGFYGSIYNNLLFETEEAAWNYWHGYNYKGYTLNDYLNTFI